MRLALLLLIALTISGQRAAPPPRYEVAAIKPNSDSDSRFAFRVESDGALAATGITLKRLMMTAYNVQGFRIVGGPAWVASKRWDVRGKPDRAATADQVRPMLLSLLEDRFQLHARPEKRKIPVYELEVDRKGSKVPRAQNGETQPIVRVSTGSVQLTKATAATFASQLSYALGRPIMDKTGLNGEFDFAIEWIPEPNEDGGPTGAGLPPGAPPPSASARQGPSIFTALQEQLGLRLKSGRDLMDVVVIDRVQMPTAN
jgi:uncharacterized protein (TIGR03435 family)